MNSRIAALERLQNGLGDTSVPVQSEEWASELFYNVNVGGWLDLRPNLAVHRAAGRCRQQDQ